MKNVQTISSEKAAFTIRLNQEENGKAESLAKHYGVSKNDAVRLLINSEPNITQNNFYAPAQVNINPTLK